MSKAIFPMMSRDEKERLSTTLEDLSRNSMIRYEVMLKRGEGMTVRQACREVAKKVNLEPRYIENIYYKR